MLNKNAKKTCLLVTGCAFAAIFSTGCRSMSGKNMFAMRGEPSAEVLAGNGPTTTYPVPPSDSATPQAIASIAGGTAEPITAPKDASMPGKTAQVSGIGVAPGYATPATNLAAAQANGIYGDSATKSAGFVAPPNMASQPAAAAFGSKALTPKGTPAATGTSFAISDIDATDGASATKASGFAPPKTSFAPPTTASYTTPPEVTNSAGSQGYSFPGDAPAMAAITPPKSDINGFESPVGMPSSSEIMPPAAVSPEFSTASAAPGVAPPSTASIGVSTSGAVKNPYSGYTPGSTGASTGYPTGNDAPATSGSFYR